MAKRKKRDEAFYRQLLKDYKQSGRSQREFAANRGIPPGTISGWFHKLRQLDAARAAQARGGPRRSSAQRRSRSAPTSTPPVESPFLPVRLVDVPAPEPRSSSSYEVILAKGTVRLPADFDPVRVGALLRSLEVVC